MQRRGRSIDSFRRRLWQLIGAQFEGKYTLLSMRARIPISSMQHYVHSAKRLPGGEHLLRIAEACGVSVDYLVRGERGVGPTRGPMHPPRLGRREEEIAAGTDLAIPVLRCTCPNACPLAADAAPPALRASRLVLEREMVGRHANHRLMAVTVTTAMPCPGWPTGTRLVVDRDLLDPRWAAVTLIHADGQCRFGHVIRREGGFLFADAHENGPRLLAAGARILGTVVVGITPV